METNVRYAYLTTYVKPRRVPGLGYNAPDRTAIINSIVCGLGPIGGLLVAAFLTVRLPISDPALQGV